MVIVRNVPSEAGLNCPLCEKRYKVRTTKKHVKDIHGKSLAYKCIYPLGGGKACEYSCGKRISCFLNHQRRTHKLKVEEMAAHRYDITTHFVVEIVEACEDVHSLVCILSFNINRYFVEILCNFMKEIIGFIRACSHCLYHHFPLIL